MAAAKRPATSRMPRSAAPVLRVVDGICWRDMELSGCMSPAESLANNGERTLNHGRGARRDAADLGPADIDTGKKRVGFCGLRSLVKGRLRDVVNKSIKILAKYPETLVCRQVEYFTVALLLIIRDSTLE
jgi:hypothetical protein